MGKLVDLQICEGVFPFFVYMEEYACNHKGLEDNIQDFRILHEDLDLFHAKLLNAKI